MGLLQTTVLCAEQTEIMKRITGAVLTKFVLAQPSQEPMLFLRTTEPSYVPTVSHTKAAKIKKNSIEI